MGRGGELQQAGAAVKAGKLNASESKLAGLADAELRKHAEERGMNVDSKTTRDDLLEMLAPYDRGILAKTPKPLPLERPPFTLKDIKDAIPRHCFERNLLKSMLHVVSDLSIVAALFYAATFIDKSGLPLWAQCILWAVYWFCQGTVGTGVWVLAHECGHQAFSDYEWVNNLMGHILHSALLVPYHSWRITHGKHHNNTGSCENDEVFCPPKRDDYTEDIISESPIANAWNIVVMLTVGWMPGYLVFNATGPPKYRGKNANHFSPYAEFFEDKDRMGIVVSVMFFCSALAGICYLGYIFGIVALTKYYIIPYMIVNLYLVLITFLQHTDVYIPHFSGKEWSWLRGALCTVDRSFGAIIDHTIHHIADTHVCHHLFSKMPFYNAQEATQAIKDKIGKYYLADETPIPMALWRSYTLCKFIEKDEGIVFYKYQK